MELDGKGGRIGDFVNLMGDGHKSIGKDFGKFLKSNVSKKSAKTIEEYEKIDAEEKANEAARQELKNRSKAEKQAAKEERQRVKEAKWKENIEKYKRD